MRRLLLTLLGLLCLGLSPAWAQSVLAPGNVAIVCAYNSSPPAIASGGFIFAQCDANGKLITSSSGGSTVNQGTSPWLVLDAAVLAAINALALTPPLAVYQYGSSQYVAPAGTGNALLSNAAVSANGSVAGTLLGYTFKNPNAVTAFVQFFDVAPGSVTLGTTVPKFIVEIPAGGYWETVGIGRTFATSITLAATTTATGSTALTTGVTIDVLDYR